jgi:GTPase Era involved in 16S rRNA processing
VERDHQKGIILGRQGAAIQTVREWSPQRYRSISLDKHIFLDISVKVLKDWRNNDACNETLRLLKKLFIPLTNLVWPIFSM